MTETCADGLLGTWAPAECPFKIAYSFRALDDIRLGVIDAFFSLPRGGAEIGGILLGKWDGRQVMILDYVSLDCEHAFGPAFTLSPQDLTRLSLLLQEARKNTPDLQPVGWYHSHTRSDIFLSDADLEIHKRYFSAPWQIALVLKPHTFQPTRGGFFFRAPNGTFHVEASYQEFVLEPLPIRPVPAGVIPPPAETGTAVLLDSSPTGKVITMPTTVLDPPAVDAEAVPEPPPPKPEPATAVAASGPAPQPDSPSVPVLVPDAVRESPADDIPIHFPDLDRRPRWRVVAVVAGVAACLAIGGIAFETRQSWLPRISQNAATVTAPPVAASLGLVLTDNNGELRIGWDRKAAAIQAATRGTLAISSGGEISSATRLDRAQLQSGSFIFKRTNEKADVVLSTEGPTGNLGRESVSFLGKLPEQAGHATNPAAANRQAALAAEVERLQGELKAELARNQKLAAQAARPQDLEKALKLKDDQIAKLRNDLNLQISHNRVLSQALDDAESQVKLQQKKRLSNQSADTAKQ